MTQPHGRALGSRVRCELVEGLPTSTSVATSSRKTRRERPARAPRAVSRATVAPVVRLSRKKTARQDARHGAITRGSAVAASHVIADARSARNGVEVAFERLRDLLLGLRSQDDARPGFIRDCAAPSADGEEPVAGLLEFPRRGRCPAGRKNGAAHLVRQRVMRSMAGQAFRDRR
jgi:hypothetical protein